MHLVINVPSHLEMRLANEAAQAGLGVEDFVLETLNDRLEPARGQESKALSGEQFLQWIRDWADQFPVIDDPVDDSRESIYAGRGE